MDARETRARLQRFLDTATMFDRAWIAWGVVWTGGVLIAFTVFDPFRRYWFYMWRTEDVVWLAAIWTGPIVGAWVLSRLVRWVASGPRE